MATTITETSVAESTLATPQTFHIGTRKSMLARVQADEVAKSLRAAWPQHTFEIHAMSTTGDNNQTTALHKFNEKALWTQELEVLLQKSELDIIVHSLKDMPTQLPADLELGAVTMREDPRDALVIKKSLASQYKSLADLPAGSVIGTSSLRRIAQLKRHYPHLRFADVRGNIGSRLAKLEDPENNYSALILAVAGLERLGMGGIITTRLSKADGNMLYAVGQGALGIEHRLGDARTIELLSRIGHKPTTYAALAERSLMRVLEGGCSVPIGVETEWVTTKGALQTAGGPAVGVKPADEYHQVSGVAAVPLDGTAAESQTDEMIMRAIVVSLDGQDAVEAESRRRVTSIEEANEFGFDMAKQLVSKGAGDILKKIELNRTIIHEQGDA